MEDISTIKNLDHEDRILLDKIVGLCKHSREGIIDEDLTNALKISEDKKLELLNVLSEHGYLKFQQSKGGSLIYLYQDPEELKKFQGLDKEDEMVYRAIADSKSKGILTNEIKNKTGLTAPQINKILKKLEGKALVKSVKHINMKNRKVWMLYELEPTDEVTGGLFYVDNAFDKDLIEALCNRTLECISAEGTASFKEIAIKLRASRVKDVDLRDDHVKSILNVLIYDDRIEEISSYSQANPMYRTSKWEMVVKSSPMLNTPCGTCPVFSECKSGYVISPETCIYFPQW
jgi:DNA-directed RNA polymerase III subunit RPC6